VADYNAAFEVADGFVAARNVASGIAVILIAILFVISLFIIANTIKLATFSRREEIAIMKMCGATNAFVRWPFVFQGLILGLVGAAVAFFIQWGIYTLIVDSVAASSGLTFIELIPFRRMAVRVLEIFAGAGFVIGVGGSLLAIRKFLQV
jgi:cell division transport system permease protein